jgi:FAD/FMN-containing dehydrogenase
MLVASVHFSIPAIALHPLRIQPIMQITWRDSATDAEYEHARVGRVFNQRRPKRFPLAVVHATCENDIVEAVKLAAERNCRVAVRSGGHSWAAWSVRDNSILIDLGNYKELEVDAPKKMAKASPSMTGRELNLVLVDKHQLMFPGGHCPDVGLGGFLLQGGMGWNCRVRIIISEILL